MGSRVARMKEGRNAFKSLTGKPTGKRPLDLIRILNCEVPGI